MTKRTMGTPKSITPLSEGYKRKSWQNYTPLELAGWAHLLIKRATNRDPAETDKIAKDLFDACNYMIMLHQSARDIKDGNKPSGFGNSLAIFNSASLNRVKIDDLRCEIAMNFRQAMVIVPNEAVEKYKQMRKELREAARNNLKMRPGGKQPGQPTP